MTTQTEPGASKSPHATLKPLWVSPKEASRLVSIGRTRLFELMAENRLVWIKVGRKRLISYASLETLGASQHGGSHG
jgi:excisionase family DNA binding protein